jgi:hypothetical protein
MQMLRCFSNRAARIVVLILIFPARFALAATPSDIQSAIERGKQYLYQTQKDGNWEVVPAPDPTIDGGYRVENMQFGGLTAIATFALLASGDDAQKPELVKAIAFLKKCKSAGTYALGMRCQIWNMIPQDESVKQAMRRDRDLLIKGIAAKEPNTGFYGYDCNKPGTDAADHSASQFGVLGMWALQQAGSEVPLAVWQAYDAGWRSHERAEGAWSYHADEDEPSTLSMTAAGVATLFITQDYTHSVARLSGNIDDPAIEKGLDWMGQHFDDVTTRRNYYTLFGISRVGLASGYKYIGNTDWFSYGADYLLKVQNEDGYWSGGLQNDNNVPDTSFSLLFLSRGRAPVLFNKLKYSVVNANNKPVPAAWDQRPRDVANLTRMIGRQIESQLNWQVVSLGQDQRDLNDAPILYMSGSAPPKLSATDRNQIKTFIENGGLVFGHADGSSLAFTDGFRKLGEAMFPGRTFAVLPANHPIYIDENFPRGNWPVKPALEGLSNGDRELMLLLPAGDPARIWQSQNFPPIRKDMFGQLMIDIALYAVDQSGLRQRGQTYLLKKDDSIQATRTLNIARLQYAGNWDPEPGGWRRLAIAMHNDRKIDLNVQAVDPATGGLTSAFQAAHLAVVGNVALSPPAIKAISNFVTNGGTLIVDVPGGAGIDRTTAEAELAKIFPTAPRPLPMLPLNNPLYSAGDSITEVHYRHYDHAAGVNLHTPRLQGWTRDDRTAVIFSPDDLTAALVGEPIAGVVGYTPESATPLMENILTYAAGKSATTQPAAPVKF